jgi:hypothetical protein
VPFALSQHPNFPVFEHCSVLDSLGQNQNIIRRKGGRADLHSYSEANGGTSLLRDSTVINDLELSLFCVGRGWVSKPHLLETRYHPSSPRHHHQSRMNRKVPNRGQKRDPKST